MDWETAIGGVDERDWRSNERVEPLRFAMVGLGGFARDHVLPAIREAAFCEATTMVSSGPEKAQQFADEFAADHAITYDEFHDGVATDEYDAVYVATPPARHLDVVETAAEFGKHVLCEKPLEATPDRARELVDRCATADVRLMVAYRLQADPHIRRVRDLVRSGVLGDVTQIHGEFSYPILAEAEDSNPWRLDPDLAGGGALMDIGIYPLNTSRFLLGEDPESVQATISSPDEGFERVDEHAAFQLRFPSGTTASCTASFNSFRGSSIQLLGTEGRVRIDDAFGVVKPRRVTVEFADGTLEFDPEPVNEIAEQCDYFADRLTTGDAIEPDGNHGLIDIVTLDSVYRAADAGHRVSPPLEEYLAE